MKLFKVRIVLVVVFHLSFSITYGQQIEDDADLIVFAVSGFCEHVMECPQNIKIMNPDTGNSVLIEVGSVVPDLIHFIPDRHLISYLTSDGMYHVLDLIRLEEIFSLQLSPFLHTYDYWSPDFNWIAISNRDDPSSLYNLFLLDTQSWERKQIIENLYVGSQLSWSPDGKHLLFPASELGEWGTYDIFLLDFETLEYTNITQNAGHNYYPAWSSDGQRFLFTSGASVPDHITIIEGDEISKVLDFAGQWIGRPEWVLDDEYFVYFVNENRGSYLYMFQLETGETVRLADKPLSGHDISTDGEKVVYLTTRPDSNLCVIYLRNLHEICFPDESPYSSGRPSWSH